MKASLSIFFLILTMDVYAQQLVISSGLERTVSGTESHFASGYQTKKQWSLGVFYQTKITTPPFERSRNEVGKDEWYGVYLNAPLAKSQRITLYAHIRVGLMNENFLMIAPSLETKVRLVKWAAVSVGSSYRQGYPAFSLKAHIHLFNLISL